MIIKAIKSTLTLWPNEGQIKPLTHMAMAYATLAKAHVGKNSVKFRHGFVDMQVDRDTDMLITILCPSTGGQVISR